MNQKRRIITVTIGLYLLSICFAIVGLLINIKTVALNKQINILKQNIMLEQRRYNELQYEYYKKTSMTNLEKLASSSQKYRPAKKIVYLNE